MKSTKEIPFTHALILAIGNKSTRQWRQNCGSVPVLDENSDIRYFNTGIPKGAADISGIVAPEGWRLEIECKALGRKRTAEQAAWGAMIVRMGGVYVLCDARDEPQDVAVARCVLEVGEAIAARRAKRSELC